VSFDSNIATIRNPRAGLLAALIGTALIEIGLFAHDHAGEASGTTAHPSANSVPHTESGTESLARIFQTEVKVGTPRCGVPAPCRRGTGDSPSDQFVPLGTECSAAERGGDGAARHPYLGFVASRGNAHEISELDPQPRTLVGTNTPLVSDAGSATNAPKKNFEWQSSWDGWDGFHFEVANKTVLGRSLTDTFNLGPLELKEVKMNGKIGGKLAVDGAAYATARQFQGFATRAEVRRARIYTAGDCVLLLPVSYEIEIGYIPHQFYIEESYLLFRDIKYLGDLKLGQYQAPMGFVTYGSSRDMTFMEPASALQALAPGVNAGLQVGRPVLDQRMTWALGLFADGVGQDFGDASKDFGRAVGRVTGVPIYRQDTEKPESQRLLHLGLSGNILYAGGSTVRYQSRPESNLAPYVVDTGNIDADGAFVFGAEVAWVNGPLSVQGEYLHSWVQANNGSVAGFGGFYVSASWFLTGESRPYDLSQGTFARVIPKHNFNWGKGGWGAWEIAGRYSFVNLNSGDIEGGRMSMLMGEVNWYLHSHVKWRFNYGFGHVAGRQPDGNLNIFQTRVEVDF
jgi:phosphate-selective porin OprO/OprP